tara:strand:+ start:2736 stop:3698 length:963 start_codon:yes stop_codon:yes gene_type:complete
MRLKKKIGDSLNWLGTRGKDKNGILLYHRVDNDSQDKFNLCVSPENFDEQMSALSASGKAVALPELVANHRNKALEPSSIAVTFDDGYLDVLNNALPILTKYQIPATVYVVTGNLGSPFWWDDLSHIIHQPNHLPDQLQINDPPTVVNCRNQSRETIYDSIYQQLRSLTPLSRSAILEELKEVTGFKSSPDSARAITPEELQELARSPLITIGAHTETHSRLSSLNAENQLSEIKTSAETLSGIIGDSVNTFSYPFGLKGRDYTHETINAVKAAGFDHALAADLGVTTNQSDVFALPRIWIHDRGQPGFSRNLKFWLGSL